MRAALALAFLLLFAPATAQATDRLVDQCVRYGWDHPVEVDHYDVYIASPPGAPWQLADSFAVPPWQICQVAFDDRYELSIVARNAGGESGRSDASIPFKWVHSFDVTEDGAVGFADFGIFAQSFNTSNHLWYFDANENNVIDFTDFGAFAARFSTTNNGTWETSWPPTFDPETM